MELAHTPADVELGRVGTRDDADDAGVLGLVVVGIMLAIRWATRMGRAGATPDRALAILRERYARGEIDKDEFEVKKRDLR